MSQAFLDKYLPDTELQCLESLLGYGTELKLTAANGTQIPYNGWAVVKFELKGKREGMHLLEVSMLATKENLDQPIVGFNVIEEVIKYCDPLQPEALVEKEVPFNSFAASFENVKVNKIETLIVLIHNKEPDELCTVKTVKRDVVIPKNQSVEVNCLVNTGPLSKRIPVLFQPDEKEFWPKDFEHYLC